MITVEMSAPYLSLAILVDAIASAVVRVGRGKEAPSEAAESAASMEWEAKLRQLAEAQAIPGHDFDTLAAQPWHLLDIERDVFWVQDLNACGPLVAAGLRFEVVKDQDRSGNAAFASAFAEETNNGRQISWRYWVGQMPSLNAADACRLLAGLDPDLYEDINARPVPQNDINGVCQKVVMLERLATAQKKHNDTAAGWLKWARENNFTTHTGFSLAVAEFAQQPDEPPLSEEVVYTLAGWPKLEARTEWTGSRLAGADYFNLEDAAELASRHAGCEVTVKDFLRAGGRGEISIHAVCRRGVVMWPTRPTDCKLSIEAGGYPTLPMAACKALALFGRAEWRHCEGWVHHDDFGGDLCSFVKWRLRNDEPPIVTTVEECMVTGWQLHALADAAKANIPSVMSSALLVADGGAGIAAATISEACVERPPEAPIEKRARLLSWFREEGGKRPKEGARGTWGALARVSKRSGIDKDTLGDLLDRAIEEKRQADAFAQLTAKR